MAALREKLETELASRLPRSRREGLNDDRHSQALADKLRGIFPA